MGDIQINGSSPAGRVIFETKFTSLKAERNRVLSALRLKALVPGEFPTARLRTVYFDDRKNTSFFESRDGNLFKKKYRLREYVGSVCGARYSLEVKIRSDRKTSKIRRLIYRDLPQGYGFTTFRDLIETFEAVEGERLNDLRLEASDAELYVDAVVHYERFRFDDPYIDARYNLDTNIMICREPGRSDSGTYLEHDIFEIKSPVTGALPEFLKGLNIEPVSFSKYAWGRGLQQTV